MSSKSRQNHQPRKPQQNDDHVDHVDGGHASLPTVEDFDEVIHVPEGKNPFQFIFLIGLLIFLLVIFIIPSAFENVLTGGSRDGSEIPGVTWTSAEGDFAFSDSDLSEALRAEDDFQRMTAMGRKQARPNRFGIARQMLLDQLSQEAGVHVSDQAMVEALRGVAKSMGGTANYKRIVGASFRGGTAAFEKQLRKELRRSRYLALTSRLAAKPLASDFQTAWEEHHTEFAFDYVQVSVLAFQDAALELAPGDASLEAWFTGGSDAEKQAVMTAPAWRLGAAHVNIGGAAPSALLERYPLGDEFDTAAAGKQFYDERASLVFKLAEPRTDEEGTEVRFEAFEDVTAEANAAAVVMAAFTAWQADMTQRAADGETIDLGAEAGDLGVNFIESPVSQERDEILADKRYGSGIMAGKLGNTEVGALLTGVTVTSEVIEVLQLLEFNEPALPPFAEYRDVAAQSWARGYCRVLALEHTTNLREGADTMDAESFAAMANEDERLTLGLVDWFDRSTEREEGDKGISELMGDPSKLFIRVASGYGLYDLGEGELSQPIEGESAMFYYLVHSLGSRQRDFSEAVPADIDGVRKAMERKALVNFYRAYSSADDSLPAYLVETYGLALPTVEAAEKAREAAEEAETTEG